MRLTLTLAVDVAAAGDPIPFTTTVEYLGPADSIHFEAAGGEWVGHGIRRFDDVAYGPWSFNLDCSEYDLKRGEVTDIPLRLATSISPETQRIHDRVRLGHPAVAAAGRSVGHRCRAAVLPEPGCAGPERWIGTSVYVTVR